MFKYKNEYKYNKKNVEKNDGKDKYNRESKNIYKKYETEYIFCTNLEINNFKDSKSNIDNIKYLFEKLVVREKKEKEKQYLGEIEFNNHKIRTIKEISKLKFTYHKLIVKEYIYSIKEYCNELNFLVNEIEGITSHRLVVGLGNPSVTETSMTLHNIYGIPYIPGQSLKGITRSYFLQKYFDIEKEEFSMIKINGTEFKAKKLYKIIFGDDTYDEENEKGSIIFFNAFPVSDEIKIEKDVMTPHYGNYYEKGWNPTDEFSTNPIPFYTVKNTKFNFLFALTKEEIRMNEEKIIYAQDLKNFVSKLIKEALEEHGVGAKTSVGYGYFNICKNDVIKKLESERQNKIDEEQKRLEREVKERKFKEDTKDMNELQIELYKMNQIIDKNKKNRYVMEFYNNNIDELEGDKRKQLAVYMKEYLENIGKWKIKKHKDNKKKDKVIERVEKICNILDIDLP
ncbi:type III-B CRISPR module RAMP protein Cmr6 [Clostridium botulinum]|nr:type III-B CRISPR module RAMP protein Cmr6 [Clostridium botulinum]NFD32108.1 type III-B CRISPR module RAMP protein Cmr6 [Clostridium botulinum]NFD58015.1 type III-B CRISPR module RAMP protein Cmr6 [Clostridium botulinum]NFD99965.1 type III-B CRISPR module RAMP protein Cmr6 [Clostridium botulinum]